MAEQNLKLPDLENTPGDVAKYETSIDTNFLPFGSKISTKEMVIAIGAVLLAAIVFYIIKNFLSKMLVSRQLKSPLLADLAGWSLFCVLLLAAIAAALAILDSTKFLTLPYLIPIGLVMLVLLVVFFIALLSQR